MLFHGLQKMTLLDFPGKVAATVFTGGCNFRCPFCHNATLVCDPASAENIGAEEILKFLSGRKGLLDGVCVTGGEPLLGDDLPDFLREVKKMGFAVKLDTNGSFPEKLSAILSAGLADYVAMDFKNSPEKYARTVGLARFDVGKILASADLLLHGKTPCEFRTTVVDELHEVEDIAAVAGIIRGAPRYFLQNFVDSGNLLGAGLHAAPREKLEAMRAAAAPFCGEVSLRGV